MADAETCTPQPTAEVKWEYVLFIVHGGAAMLCSGLLATALCVQNKVRWQKEHGLIALLAATQCFTGAAYHVNGIYRTTLLYLGYGNCPMGHWECFYKSPGWMFKLAIPLMVVMMHCVSVDRVLAIALPTHYYKFGTPYMRKLVAVHVLVALATSATCYTASYLSPRDVPMTMKCSSTTAINNQFVRTFVFYGLTDFACTSSVVLYILVPLLYKRHRRLSQGGHNARINLHKMQFQRRLSITMGLLALCNVVLMVIPNIVRSVLVQYEAGDPFIKALRNHTELLYNVNSIATFGIFVWRHRNIRDAVKYTLMLRKFTVAKPVVTTKSAAALQPLPAGGTQYGSSRTK